MFGSKYNPAFGHFDANSLDDCQSICSLSIMSHIGTMYWPSLSCLRLGLVKSGVEVAVMGSEQ